MLLCDTASEVIVLEPAPHFKPNRCIVSVLEDVKQAPNLHYPAQASVACKLASRGGREVEERNLHMSLFIFPPEWAGSGQQMFSTCGYDDSQCQSSMQHLYEHLTLTKTLSQPFTLGRCLFPKILAKSCRLSTTAGSGFFKLTQALFTPSNPIPGAASACCSRSSGTVSMAYADSPSSSTLPPVHSSVLHASTIVGIKYVAVRSQD